MLRYITWMKNVICAKWLHAAVFWIWSDLLYPNHVHVTDVPPKIPQVWVGVLWGVCFCATLLHACFCYLSPLAGLSSSPDGAKQLLEGVFCDVGDIQGEYPCLRNAVSRSPNVVPTEFSHERGQAADNHAGRKGWPDMVQNGVPWSS